MAPAELPGAIARIETRLQALGDALRQDRAEAVAAEAAELQRALAAALEPLRRGAPLPPALQERLALARAQVAAQREALARAGAAVDRALEVLLPAPQPHAAYSAAGLSPRRAGSGMLSA